MRRFRRKPKVTWLPQPGTPLENVGTPPAEPLENWSGIEFVISTTNTGEQQTVIAPMVVDQPPSETFTGSTLDIYRQSSLNFTEDIGYRLRRICGDIHIAVSQPNDQLTNTGALLLELAIVVAKVENVDGIPTAPPEHFDVASIQNNPDPYIWKRSFAMSAIQPGSGFASKLVNTFPDTSSQFGTKWHQAVDQKTARRIGREERLFFIATAWPLPMQTAIAGAGMDGFPEAYILFSYRTLATLFNNGGNRRNASI